MKRDNVVAESMDAEWIELILEAKTIGLSIETVREFLFQNGVTNSLIKKP